MRSTAYLVRHDTLIAEQRALRAAPETRSPPVTRKIFTLRSAPEYAWARRDLRLALGRASPDPTLETVHGAQYADYSHGVRLVSGSSM